MLLRIHFQFRALTELWLNVGGNCRTVPFFTCPFIKLFSFTCPFTPIVSAHPTILVRILVVLACSRFGKPPSPYDYRLFRHTEELHITSGTILDMTLNTILMSAHASTPLLRRVPVNTDPLAASGFHVGPRLLYCGSASSGICLAIAKFTLDEVAVQPVAPPTRGFADGPTAFHRESNVQETFMK
jgi:hypothetical protein